jgi:transposase
MTPREAELQKQHQRELQEKDARIAQLSEQIERALEEISRVNLENKLLREKVDALLRRLFGAKSETLDPEQLLFLLQGFERPPEPGKAPEPAAQEDPRRSKAPSPPRERGPRLPEHLPVVEEVIVPQEVKDAPEQWRQIGEEASERLDYEPAKFLRRRTVRPTYVSRKTPDAAPLTAPLPASLLDGSIVTPGLLAQIVTAKYCQHLPLYRQESIYWTQHKVKLSRQTMAQWVGLAADWLQPIYGLIREGVLEKRYVQVDETPIAYLEPGNRRTKLGYFWACNAPAGDVFFHWTTSRAASCLNHIVPESFSGTIQCDGYEAYDCFARGRGGKITLTGCLAHVRRKFHEAKETAPKTAGWFLTHFRHLYELEARLRQQRAGPKLRAAERASLSRPVLTRIYRALMRLKASHRYLPQSAMGKAISYALNQWSALQAWLEDGRLEIDNNLVENAIRPTAVGKKNWLFVGDAAAGERGAVIYTVIEACRRRGIDPFEYLRDVFTRLPSMTNWQVKDITPEAWAKARKRPNPKTAALKAAA